MNRPTLDGPSTNEALLRRVEAHILAGEALAALRLLGQRRSTDRLLENARGVCLLRLGRVRDAVELYRGVVLQPDSMTLAKDLPAELVVNFATALLFEDRVIGCLLVLDQLGQDGHPSVARLRTAIERWREGLGFWERLSFRMYGTVPRPIALDGPPGELLLPAPRSPRRAA